MLFEGLEPGTEYEIRVTGQYDLDEDGNAENSSPYILNSKIFTTDIGKKIPEASIHLEDDSDPTIVSNNSIELHYDLTDVDSTLVVHDTIKPKIVVYKDSELIQSTNAVIGSDTVLNIENLETDTDYTVKVTGYYDLDSDDIPDTPEPVEFDLQIFHTKN